MSTLIKLVIKAYKFSVTRPLQRFNVYNRAKKYLGPDAKYFLPAPRAIGAMSKLESPPQYPHLEPGEYKSVKERRLEALARIGLPMGDDLPKAFSETREEDNLVIETSNKLEVTKTVTRIEPLPHNKLLESGQQEEGEGEEKKLAAPTNKRPLPTSVNLPLQDMRVIWQVDKTPPGRLNLDMLQELMLNKLADDKYWTSKEIAERYQIKEEYAEDLINHLKQIRIVVSPRLGKLLDYVGRENEAYQASKHLVYHVAKHLRTKIDKQYDHMFLPNEEIDPEVKKLLDVKDVTVVRLDTYPLQAVGKLTRKPEPLRIGAVNAPPPIDDSNTTTTKTGLEPKRRLPAPRKSEKPSGDNNS